MAPALDRRLPIAPPSPAIRPLHSNVVSDVLADMKADGGTPPEPSADRTWSGRFVVRVPPETHRDLVIKAAEKGVSLNRLVSARLAG